MANRKISDLTALTAPATGDLLPIVDISEAAAADKNKKITYGELLASAPDGSAAAPSFSFDSDPDSGLYSAGANQVALATNGTGRLYVDADGRLLVGTSSARSNFFNTSSIASSFQVEGTTYGTSSLSLIANGTTASVNPYPLVILARTRGTSVGSTTIVSSGDMLGGVSYQGADGTEFVEAASIIAEVDGTPGANDMPGRLVFSTTADGAASPTERMRIKSTGIVNIANTPTYADNAAATSGGLVAGDIYRKSDGTLMIRY